MKKSTIEELTHRELQLVLCYAPAGLGHLRITDALYHGLPETVNPVVLGSRDESIRILHRLTSLHPIGRAAFEWLQTGPLAPQANGLYRSLLRINTHVVYEEIAELLAERLEPPKEILAVCTHFGLAHKLAAIKEQVQKEQGVRMILVVFVSDDTFQHIWYVDGADLLVVASQYIKRKYAAHGELLGKRVRIEVVPYPLHPRLGRKLDALQMAGKRRQLEAKGEEPIHVSIPISGAAVGTGYFSRLIGGLREKSDRFRFHIVSKDAPFTKDFMSQMRGKAWVDLQAGKLDREVVDLYDLLMDNETISLEVTKPSEQAFKGLLGTQSRGGVILLLSEPVGSQEHDNLDFLVRHSLIPSEETNEQLWQMVGEGAGTTPALRARLVGESRTWRGVRIPSEPQKASDIIWWMLTSGMFARMLEGNLDRKVRDEHSQVLGSDGVEEFWDLVTSL
jgi:hypothetical protein